MFRTTTFSAALLLLVSGCGQRPAGTDDALSDLFPTSRQSQARDIDESWTAASSPRQFNFPADHGAHEDYRIEWWYYTGNLQADDGRRFGYQLTFFRTGLRKQPDNPSRWAVRDLYTGHFAISDIDNQQHVCFQRNNRQGLGQAGTEKQRYEVWNGDWKAWREDEKHRLQAAEANVSIDLTLLPAKPPVVHGDRGLSRKGSTPGNASYYYSLTRLPTEGTVRLGGKTFAVRGSSWMDHEFSTSFLEPGQRGWDWMAIQLDSDVELMLYRMCRDDGTTDPHSSGSLIDKMGSLSHLSARDYTMTPHDSWESSQTGAVYPLHWSVAIPSLGYQLRIRPAFEAQEMTTNQTTGISYWEGAIDVKGDGPEGSVTGRGYMELTGYAGEGLGSLFE